MSARTSLRRESAAERTSSPVGAPKKNRNAEKHGLYATPDAAPPTTINGVIDDLAEKQHRLSQLIQVALTTDDTDLDTISHLFALHGQNASRLGRLLRDKRALSGEAADGIAGAIAQALDELGTELGADL